MISIIKNGMLLIKVGFSMRTLFVLSVCFCLIGSLDASARRDKKRREINVEMTVKRPPVRSVTSSLQEELKGMAEEMRYDYLMEQLKKYPNYWREAAIHLELAKMYESIGDLREALMHAKKAQSIDENNRDIHHYHKKLSRTVDPKPTIGQKIRAYNEREGLSIENSYGLEYDSNVIQEEVDPANATNKEDESFKFNVSVTKAWNSSKKNLSQESYYAFSNQNYFDHTELNLLINTLEHRFIWDNSHGEDAMNVIYKVGVNHILNKDNALLWNWTTGPSLYYYHSKWNILWNADLSYSRASYFAKSNDDQEGDTIALSINGTSYLDTKQSQSLQVGVSETYEHLKGATSQYLETVFSILYEKTFTESILTSVGPYIEYKLRGYQHAATGSPKRDDDQWNLGFDLKMSLIKDHRLQLSANMLENDSNISTDHYRERKVALIYGISF